jgi:hypothetical protein
MTLREAYIYMLATLETYYDNTHNDELGGLLGGLTLWHPLSPNEKPADPASWNDWLNVVRIVMDRDSVNNIETLQATVNLLREYNDHQGFNLKEVISFVQTKLDRCVQAENTWKRNLSS